MRVPFAAWLLCLMIVGGSLDSVPAPPAVNPHGGENRAVSQLNYHGPATAKSPQLDCLSCAPHFQSRWFSFGQIFENRGPAYKLTFVRQATDTSPPCFS